MDNLIRAPQRDSTTAPQGVNDAISVTTSSLSHWSPLSQRVPTRVSTVPVLQSAVRRKSFVFMNKVNDGDNGKRKQKKCLELIPLSPPFVLTEIKEIIALLPVSFLPS